MTDLHQFSHLAAPKRKYCKREHDLITRMISNLVGGLEVDNFEKLAMILLRPDTKYLLFKDTIGMPHIKFDQFSAPFFFICRINLNLTELRKDDDIRMDPYMPS